MCTTDKTHVHKDLKQLVLNVTDNTTEKLIGKKTKTKCKPKQKQECPQAKSSPIKVPQQPSQNAEDQGKLSTKVCKYLSQICLRGVTQSHTLL